MKIRNLPFPVTTARAEWILATTWMGVTPGADNLTSCNKCVQNILTHLNRITTVIFLNMRLKIQ